MADPRPGFLVFHTSFYLIFTATLQVGDVRIPILQMKKQSQRAEATFLVGQWPPGVESIAV